MTAVGHTCNLQALIDAGAAVNARNKAGVSALKLAIDQKQGQDAELLRQAALQPKAKLNNH
jgi:hypothetical protein